MIRSADINDSKILRVCIYTNINELRQNLYLMFNFAIYNLSTNCLAYENTT